MRRRRSLIYHAGWGSKAHNICLIQNNIHFNYDTLVQGGNIMLHSCACVPFIIRACLPCRSWSLKRKQCTASRNVAFLFLFGTYYRRSNNEISSTFALNDCSCMTICRCLDSPFPLVKSILAVPTMSFVCVTVLCGCVWPCLQEFMDDGCCEIQWKPKWKSNCSVNVCIWTKIGWVHEYVA